uniref:Transcription factor Iwr1 domain-containing protein n=1 Tax=Meloidogyne javanica TaxID=6303 RepID=A0A915LKV8_MELJA
MEIEQNIAINESKLDIKLNRAPIAQEEIQDVDEYADEYFDLPVNSSSPCLIQSTSQRSESMIVHIGERHHQKHGKQRRKRKQDPFGNLILSTKKMKLNDVGNEKDKKESNEGQQSNSKSFTIEEADDIELFYGGDDESGDSADDYDDEDSNAEQYYANDYPDEDGANEFENESTSEDGYFGWLALKGCGGFRLHSLDHYGDEQPKYRNYAYELSSDQEDLD